MESVVTVESLRFSIFQPVTTSSDSAQLLPSTLLLHGYLGSGSNMRCLATFLCERGHVVLVPDLPLHGSSYRAFRQDSPSSASALISSAVSSILSCRNLPLTVAIVGYSLGGRIALELAAAPGQLIPVALALLSSGMPPATLEEGCAMQSRSFNLAEVVRGLSVPQSFEAWLRDTWYQGAMWGGLRDAPQFPDLVGARVATIFEEGAHCENENAARLDAISNAARVYCASRMSRDLSIPPGIAVLYFYGDRDVKYKRVAADMRRRFVPHMDAISVENAGHNVLVQQFDFVATCLRRFLLPKPLEVLTTPLTFGKVRVHPYEIPLKEAMKVGGCTVSSRCGALVALQSQEGGFVGVGDIAPLPGLHETTLAECLEEIRLWVQLGTRRIRDGVPVIGMAIADMDLSNGEGSTKSLSTATRFAVTCALLQSVSAANGIRASNLIASISDQFCNLSTAVTYNSVIPRPASRIPSFSTAGWSTETIFACREQDRNHGQVCKLKVGFTGLVEDDIQMVRAIAASFRASRGLLRLDANQSWSQGDFVLFCNRTEEDWDVIEYVEEPFAVTNASDFVRFCHGFYGQSSSCGKPRLGLDESLSQFSLEDARAAIAAPGVAAVVLKPAVHGDLAIVTGIAKYARRLGIKIVLSSVFESGVGLAWVTAIAAACEGSRKVAHGVGTFSGFSRDVVSPGFNEACVDGKEGCVNVELCEQFLETTAMYVLKHGLDLLAEDKSKYATHCSRSKDG